MYIIKLKKHSYESMTEFRGTPVQTLGLREMQYNVKSIRKETRSEFFPKNVTILNIKRKLFSSFINISSNKQTEKLRRRHISQHRE